MRDIVIDTMTTQKMFKLATIILAFAMLTIPVLADAIVIERVDVKVGDTDKTGLLDKGSVIAQAEPGTPIEFRVKVKNNLQVGTSSDVSKLRNVFSVIRIIGIDDGSDLEIESDDYELFAQDSRFLTMTFSIPQIVEEGNYDVEVYAEARDRNGTYHTDSWMLELSVTKKSHNVRILSERLASGIVDCDRNNEISFGLINLGSNDEKEVYVRVESSDLGLKIIDGPYQLDANQESDENSISRSFKFRVPDTTVPGKYRIDLRAYYLSDVVSSVRQLPIEVRECKTPQIQQINRNTSRIATAGDVLVSDASGNALNKSTNESHADVVYSQDTGKKPADYLALLIVANIAAFAALFFLGYRLLFRK